MSDRWEATVPGEEDTIDLTVLIMFDGEEVIRFNYGTLAVQKVVANNLCLLLNGVEATLE